jgi:N-acetylmuramoyl-L-alanine amidase
MSKHKVFIEPGHNEFTFKTEGSKGGKYTDGIFEEFDFNIAISEEIINGLKPYSKFFEVIQLEFDNNKVDNTLSERIAKINSLGQQSDLVISNHANAGTELMSGQWGFYASESGLKFLNLYAENSKESLIKYKQHFKCIENTWSSFGIVLKTKPVAVLIEYGFFTNVNDRKILRSPIFIKASAEKVVKTILQYYNIKPISKKNNWQEIIKQKSEYHEIWIDKINKLNDLSNKYDLGEFNDILRNLSKLIELIGN